MLVAGSRLRTLGVERCLDRTRPREDRFYARSRVGLLRGSESIWSGYDKLTWRKSHFNQTLPAHRHGARGPPAAARARPARGYFLPRRLRRSSRAPGGGSGADSPPRHRRRLGRSRRGCHRRFFDRDRGGRAPDAKAPARRRQALVFRRPDRPRGLPDAATRHRGAARVLPRLHRQRAPARPPDQGGQPALPPALRGLRMQRHGVRDGVRQVFAQAEPGGEGEAAQAPVGEALRRATRDESNRRGRQRRRARRGCRRGLHRPQLRVPHPRDVEARPRRGAVEETQEAGAARAGHRGRDEVAADGEDPARRGRVGGAGASARRGGGKRGRRRGDHPRAHQRAEVHARRELGPHRGDPAREGDTGGWQRGHPDPLRTPRQAGEVRGARRDDGPRRAHQAVDLQGGRRGCGVGAHARGARGGVPASVLLL